MCSSHGDPGMHPSSHLQAVGFGVGEVPEDSLSAIGSVDVGALALLWNLSMPTNCLVLWKTTNFRDNGKIFICALNWTVLSNRGRLKISSPWMSGLYFVWSEVQFKAQDKSWTNHQKPTCHNSSPLWPTATQCITWPRPRQEYQPQPQEGSDSPMTHPRLTHDSPTTHPWLTHDSIHDSSTTHFTTHLRLTHDSLMTPYDSLWLDYDSVALSRTHIWVDFVCS